MSTSSSLLPERRICGFSYREVGGEPSAAAARSPGAIPQKDGLQEAILQAEAQARTFFEQQLATERESLQKTLRSFESERREYYQKIEVEVVQLALAIARRVLHREVSADPLLLAGMARVALEKLENKSEVVLRVHPDLAAQWRTFFASTMELRHAPEVQEDPGLERGRYILQTALGSTELGLEAQLKEVEQSLGDLQAYRPRVEG